jgi:hypothetical protein
MTRYMVIVHVIDTSGPASKKKVRQFFLNATSEREAWRKARDVVANDRQDVDGVPEIRRAEPGDETIPNRQERMLPTREGFYRE